jgi:ABC-2 type transport system ATP-binding protein
LRGARTLGLRLRGASEADLAALRQVPGVRELRMVEQRDGVMVLEVDVEQAADVAEPLARAVIERGVGLRELAPLGMSLEDIFLELTTREEAGA